MLLRVQEYGDSKDTAVEWLDKHPDLKKLDEVQSKIRAGSWEFIKECDAYVTHTAVTRRATNANATQRRRRAIEEKLIAKGFAIEKLPAEFWQDKAVAQARDLSDRSTYRSCVETIGLNVLCSLENSRTKTRRLGPSNDCSSQDRIALG